MIGPCEVVLAIDPGSAKCGVAIVTKTKVLYQAVIPVADLESTIIELNARFNPQILLLGNSTASSKIAQILKKVQQVPVVLVDEAFTTIQARRRFFEENPPQGLRKLIPLSLQVPSRAYDDYVAVILAERYFAENK